MNILMVVGARPQFIKAEPLSRAFAEAGHRQILVHTGQHYDYGMSEVFFRDLDIPQPDLNLGVGSASHGRQTGQMLIELEDVMLFHKPDWVVVVGDTNSTLAGALAAAKLRVPLAHVEAGLRPSKEYRWIAEHINRLLTDQMADLLFAPTQLAVSNLRQENICPSKIVWVGDVTYDAFLHAASKVQQKSALVEDLGLVPRGYVLATVHRAENTEYVDRFQIIFQALSLVAREMPVVLPLHPRTRRVLQHHGMLEWVGRSICLIEPVGYLDMLRLERDSAVIASDSGGVQKEAFFWQVPCVTLLEETEWFELVEYGWNRVCPPTESQEVAKSILAAIGSKGRDMDLYGGGMASRRVADVLTAAQKPA